MEQRISVTFAALARIIIDDRFLLINNKGFYTPIGGALKLDMSHKSFLDEMGAELTYGDDLRMTVPESEWTNLRRWFNGFCWRELTIYREVMEELQPLLKTDISDLKEVFIRNEYIEKDYGPAKKDTLYKNRIFQIHDVFLSKAAMEECFHYNEEYDDLVLVSSEDILKRSYISAHSKYIL